MLNSVSTRKKSQVPVGEKALIAAIRARTVHRNSSVRIGIGDDCAVLRQAHENELVVTTDLSLEQVHFRRDWHPPESAGHRCIARGLSDIAAMGAQPIAAFLSLAVPIELTVAVRGKSWLDRFLNGLLALAAQHRVPLAGGDTAQSPLYDEAGSKQTGMVLADIVLIGSVPEGRVLLRSGAKAGDILYVTGGLGGAEAELLALGRDPQAFRKLTKFAPGHPHLYPEPRLSVAAKLLALEGINAAIDVSDGLSTDLAHLCEESGLAAEINAATIPVHPLAQKIEKDGWIPSALHIALNGGEDYELLFAAPPGTTVPRKIAGIPIHSIGSMKPHRKGKPLLEMIEPNGKRVPIDPGGWEHFR